MLGSSYVVSYSSSRKDSHECCGFINWVDDVNWPP